MNDEQKDGNLRDAGNNWQRLRGSAKMAKDTMCSRQGSSNVHRLLDNGSLQNFY